jgi:glucosamine-6-phosphate deaminase
MPMHYLSNPKTPTLVFPTSAQASIHLAQTVEDLIRKNNSANRSTVLGLPTGSTPLGFYRELIRRHQEGGLDFSRVVTFNLDEYYPMPKDDPHSYNRWMHETVFKHINIPSHNIHIPDGTVPLGAVDDHCDRYEELIRKAGGIDLQILGVGRTGHIGFNEPGSTRRSRTRLVTLDPVTRRDAAGAFFGEENVPHQAITMGVGSILEARKIVVMAFGEHKAPPIKKALEGDVSDAVAASFLQQHPDATFLLDAAAAAQLVDLVTPWIIGPIDWTPARIRQALIWLALKVNKGLLKLDDDDFRENHLYELLREHGPAEKLGQRVFDDREETITHYPAGKVEKTGRQRVLIFSPHPDDDVISMGGTLIRLVEQGHEPHIAYMTSGNIAVFDHDAVRFIDYAVAFNRLFQIDVERTGGVCDRVQKFLKTKTIRQCDTDELLKIKTLIRETEARAAALACGVPPEQLIFMDLRFYRTGTIAKAPIHPHDIDDICALLEKLRPAQIYVAGEMSDPHGTHRTCAEAIYEAVRRVGNNGQKFEVWLYRGAWEEYEPHELERVVPLSPDHLERKRQAVFRHQSQKDRAMFPGGSDRREFWQRAEDRNKNTARVYDRLGLPEFYALEGFVQWREE